MKRPSVTSRTAPVRYDAISLARNKATEATSWGSQDGQGQQQRKQVTTMSLITDALGIKLGDKITVGGQTVYVTSVDTPKDEVGIDLMHTITTSTEKEG